MLKCFRFSYKGNYFVVTDKVRRNRNDAIKILNLITRENNMQLKDYTEKVIENTIKTIQYQMELVNVKINEHGLSFNNSNGGGAGYTIKKQNVGYYYITD